MFVVRILQKIYVSTTPNSVKNGSSCFRAQPSWGCWGVCQGNQNQTNQGQFLQKMGWEQHGVVKYYPGGILCSFLAPDLLKVELSFHLTKETSL